MRSFRLKNKEEEQKIFEDQKKQTEINRTNKNLNFISKNPQTTGAFFMGVIGCVIELSGGRVFSVILMIFAARKLLRAKKIGENKKYINFSYVVVYLPILFWILNSFVFVITMLK